MFLAHTVLPVDRERNTATQYRRLTLAVNTEPPMTVIADITVPASSFTLGQVMSDIAGVEIELERIVPLQEAVMPLCWISGRDPEQIETILRDHPQTKTVDRLTTTTDRTLFEVHWRPDSNGLIGVLIDTRAKILEATGTDETWDFRLRFGSHSELSAFNMALTEDNIPVTLRHIYNPTPREDQPALSAVQRQTLLSAYDQGYFRVPRRTTLSELAERQEVSDSALSQRIRRGIAGLIEHTLLTDDAVRSR